jgi:anti-sigma regulatory factor (Ser/Thr protein kinase)
MDTALKVRLPASKKAPALARKALDALDGELTGLREQARLLVSELVTNAVRHADLQAEDKIELVVVEAPSAVRIEVADPSDGFEPPAQPSRHPDGGFGLYFVDRIADRWGADHRAVWFELDRPPA